MYICSLVNCQLFKNLFISDRFFRRIIVKYQFNLHLFFLLHDRFSGKQNQISSLYLGSVETYQISIGCYKFTILTCITGVIDYNDTKIQLPYLVGIIECAAD